MKIFACFVLLCVAVAISATRSKHHDGHGSNTDDTSGKGRRPGQQIGSPDDESTSRSFSSSDRGSQSAGSVLGGTQALHDGQEGRSYVGGQRSAVKQGTNIGSRDSSSQPRANPFQNMGNSGSAESASNSAQSGAARNGNGGLEDLSRAYRNGYRPRGPFEYDRLSREEGQQNGRSFRRPSRKDDDSGSWEGEQNGRRFRRPTWRDDDSRSSEEERPPRRRNFEPRYRDEHDSRSSEEYRPRRESGRPYPRRGGEDSMEDRGRPFGQRRPSSFEGFGRSG